MSFVNFKKISIEDIENNAKNVKKVRDYEIIKRDIELEQAAIDEYQGQLADASPELKKILEHLIIEEQEHRRELEEFQKKKIK